MLLQRLGSDHADVVQECATTERFTGREVSHLVPVSDKMQRAHRATAISERNNLSPFLPSRANELDAAVELLRIQAIQTSGEPTKVTGGRAGRTHYLLVSAFVNCHEAVMLRGSSSGACPLFVP